MVYLLVVHVAGAADERGPAFRVQLQGGDAVPAVSLSRNLRGQHLQAVPGGQAWDKNTVTPKINPLSQWHFTKQINFVAQVIHMTRSLTLNH